LLTGRWGRGAAGKGGWLAEGEGLIYLLTQTQKDVCERNLNALAGLTGLTGLGTPGVGNLPWQASYKKGFRANPGKALRVALVVVPIVDRGGGGGGAAVGLDGGHG